MVFLEAVHITNKFAQHGDTLITSVTNMPEQMDVRVTNLPDSIGLANNLSAFHNMIDTIDSVVQHISHSGAGYPDWATDIVFPLVIAMFALIFPILISVISRLDERYKSSIYANIIRYSWQYVCFVLFLGLAGVFVLSYAISFEVCEHKPITNYFALSLIVTSILVVIFTAILLRYLLKASAHKFLVVFLKKSLRELDFITELRRQITKRQIRKLKQHKSNLQIFEIVCKYALETKDEELLIAIHKDFFDLLVAKMAKVNNIISLGDAFQDYELELVNALLEIHQYAYKETNASLRNQLSKFVSSLLSMYTTIPSRALMRQISLMVLTAQEDSEYYKNYFVTIKKIWSKNIDDVFLNQEEALEGSTLRLQENAISFKNRNFVLCSLLYNRSPKLVLTIEDKQVDATRERKVKDLMPQSIEALLTMYVMLMYRIGYKRYDSLSDEDLVPILQSYVLHYASKYSFDWSNIGGTIRSNGIDLAKINSYLLSLSKFSEQNDSKKMLFNDIQLATLINKIEVFNKNYIAQTPLSMMRMQAIAKDMDSYCKKLNYLFKNLCQIKIIDATTSLINPQDTIQCLKQIKRSNLLDHYVEDGSNEGRKMMREYLTIMEKSIYKHLHFVPRAITEDIIYDCAGLKRCLYAYKVIPEEYVILAVGLNIAKLIKNNWFEETEEGCSINEIPIISIPVFHFSPRWRRSILLIRREELPIVSFSKPTNQKIRSKKWKQSEWAQDIRIYTCQNEITNKYGDTMVEIGILVPYAFSAETFMKTRRFIIKSNKI